jgi:threonine/homoserine/homoserine lactone efflux protein
MAPMTPGHSVDLGLALTAALVMGLRHGIDYDHIAAISDLSRLEESPRRAMRLGMFYVLGHAATVSVLAAAVIFFQKSLPAGIDRWTERLVGLTLLILGVYVLATLFRTRHHQHWVPSSRFLLLANAARWSVWRLRQTFHSQPLQEPEAMDWARSNTPAFIVGIIHGLGAETPSQLLLFLLAANLGGTGRGFLGLAMFLVGLIAMNTVMCASMAGLSGAGNRRPAIARAITVVTAGYSVVVGVIFLLGSSSVLPPLGGG